MADAPKREQGKHATPLPQGIAWRVDLARAGLWWEHVWPALWPPLAALGLYALLGLSGALQALPLLAAWAVLILTLAAVGVLLWQARAAFAWPSREAALRRLEAMNRLTHRPLSTYGDTAAKGTGSDRLWAAHRQSLKARLTALQVRLPEPRLAAKDPFALRAALLLSLVAAFVAAGSAATNRLGFAFFPGFSTAASVGRLDAWITPPAYTGRAPVFLTEKTGEPIEVPEASTLTVQIFGGSTPGLTLADEDIPFASGKENGVQAYQVEAELTHGGKLVVNQGSRTFGGWDLTVLPDTPPTVTLLEQVTATRRQTLRFLYQLTDDYGVADLKANLALDPVFVLEDKPIFYLGEERQERKGFNALIDGFVAEPVTTVLDMPLPGLNPTDASHTAYKDLTAHPWAGLPVMIDLIARDDAGQTGKSRKVSLTLPARRFEKPLAAAIVEQRQRLALSPLNRGSVAGFLNAFAKEPDTYIDDPSVYLGLRAAYWRLVKARRPGDLTGVSDLLWDLALHIEDGDLSLTERDLRAAREALMQALADGASPDELEQLMQDLKSALARYLNELSDRASAETDPDHMPPPDGRNVERSDLEDMLAAIGDLARTGARDQAQDLLSQLDELLENMETAQGERGPSEGENALSEAIGEMGDLIERQRNLMDETFRHGQGAQAAPENGERGESAAGERAPPLENLKAQQEALRQKLEELMGELGEKGQPIPSELERAAQAMENAEDRLAQGRSDAATGAQGQAIDQLRQGAQALADAMFDAMAEGDQPGSQSGGDRVDPLGRPQSSSGPNSSENVSVPDELDLQRARQILEELRERAAELGRPQEELDYLERLLRRF
ncbi:MAG: TIGR02302 family protein [Parvibaculaceae bacterium]